MGIDRRSFISLVAGGAAGSLFTPVIWKTLDDISIWTQNWSWTPRLKYGEEGKTPAHWVVCEGISAAAALRRALLDDGRGEIEVEIYEHCYRSWIDYCEEYVIKEPGV